MIRFNDTIVYADLHIDPHHIHFYFGNRGLEDRDNRMTIALTEDTTDEQKLANEMRDRLLNLGPVLTLDMLQRAYDAADCRSLAPTAMIMHPDTRRQYLALIDADQRYSAFGENE